MTLDIGVHQRKKKVGGDLSGDVRHEVLKDLHKSDLDTLFIGNFDGFKRDVKFTRKLEKHRATLDEL